MTDKKDKFLSFSETTWISDLAFLILVGFIIYWLFPILTPLTKKLGAKIVERI